MTNAADPPEDVRKALERLIAEVLQRRAAGEPLPDAAVLRAHPHLAPYLADELALLVRLERAFVAAQVAGPIHDDPIVPMSHAELDRPIAEDALGELDVDIAIETSAPPSRPTIPGYAVEEEIGRGGQAVV